MNKDLTFKILIFLSAILQNFAFGQKTIDGTYLFKKNDKYFLDNKLYSGQVVHFKLGQVSHKYTMEDGIPTGIYTTYYTDNNFIRERYRDTTAIRKFRTDSIIESEKINKLINDSIAIFRQIEEFKAQIGGEKKLNKLKDQYVNDKLNKKNQELWNNFSLLSANTVNKRNEIKLSNQKYYEVISKIKTEQEKTIHIPKLKEEYEQINFVKSGTYKEYSESGNVLSYGRFKDNLQVDEWIYNYENGKLKGKGFFNSGRGGEADSKGIPKNGREGKWLVYHGNGNLYYESEFKGGKLNGISKIYFENGQVKEETFYKDDIKEGLAKIFYENGKLLKEYTMSGNELSNNFIEYFENGNKKTQTNYLNGNLNGPFKNFYESGKVQSEGNYSNGLMIGQWKYYYSNGNLKASGAFDSGNGFDVSTKSGLPMNGRNGNWKFYYESGKLESEANYKNGYIVGEHKSFYENGNVKAISNGTERCIGCIENTKKFNQDGTPWVSAWKYYTNKYTNRKEIITSQINYGYKTFCIKSSGKLIGWSVMDGEYLYGGKNIPNICTWYITINGEKQEEIMDFGNPVLLPEYILEKLINATELAIKFPRDPVYYEFKLNGLNEALDWLKN